ncbi:MAG: ABC transporter ATP-binding protein [Pseudomonadota bacterium]|nr:ABC transporter ATP-binding protein [Pseudomonadota bacterium]
MSRRHPVSDHASTVKLSGRLWAGYLGRYWLLLAMALAAMLVYAASTAALPVGVEWINSAFAGGENRFSADVGDVLRWGPFVIILLGAVNAGSQFLQARLSQTAALSALRDLQRDMFDRLMRFDYAQMKDDASGQLISRFTNDTAVLRETLTRATTGVRDSVTLIALCATMIWYDWVLFLVVAIIYPLAAIPISRIGKYLRRSSGEAQAQAGDITTLVGETIAGARMVKTYQLEDYERARADVAFDRRFHLLDRMARMRALNEPLIFLVGSIAITLVVVGGAWRISTGALEGAQFIPFILTLLLLSQPARALSSLNAAMQEGLAAFERMLDILDREPEVVDSPDSPVLTISRGAISFRDVSFSYGQGAPALDGFSLDAPAGASVALVGESGAGKSTVFHLLPRLYDLKRGSIVIDGQNIAGVSLSSLRKAISVVSQEAILFNDTMRANIAFGRPGASETEIVAAARAAAIDEFIRSLPKGYDSIAGEAGANLSGGQRQRISLARAFLKDAPILLLDEATSALDAESEAQVQAAIERLTKGRTTLVIAHRLATVVSADLIAVMDKGRVVETGTHDELIERRGLYARLAELQFRAPARV